MRTTELPAGYMLVNNVAMHVAQVRRFTSDIRRFRQVAPLVDELMRHTPATPPWERELEALLTAHPSLDVPAIATTLREIGEIACACADEAQQEQLWQLDGPAA